MRLTELLQDILYERLAQKRVCVGPKLAFSHPASRGSHQGIRWFTMSNVVAQVADVSDPLRKCRQMLELEVALGNLDSTDLAIVDPVPVYPVRRFLEDERSTTVLFLFALG